MASRRAGLPEGAGTPSLTRPTILNYLGYSWVEQGKNLDRARRMIENAVRQMPQAGYIVDSLGWVQYRLGDIQVR